MSIYPSFNYRNILILHPFVVMCMTSVFFFAVISDITTGGQTIQEKRRVTTVCEPCAEHPGRGPHDHVQERPDAPIYPGRYWLYPFMAAPFLVFLGLSIRSLLSYLNERIVLTDTTIERYGYLGERIFVAPLTSIKRLSYVICGNNISTYQLVTDQGNFYCSDALIGFKGFQSCINEIIEQNQRAQQQRIAAEQRELMRQKIITVTNIESK